MRVVTYNVLASAYIKPESYPKSSEEVLDPANRLPALVERIQSLDADVLLLQEVDAELYAALVERLEPAGYSHRYLARSQGQTDGCATFARALPDMVWHELVYSDGDRGQADSGHVALTLETRLGGRRLIVANTHLKWDPPGVPPAALWGARQISQLVESLSALGPEGTIIGGDLNVVPRDEVVRLLRKGGFKEAFDGEHATFTMVGNKKARKIDYLFHSAKVRAKPHQLPTLKDDSALPSEREPSDHLPVVVDFDWMIGSGRR